MAHILLRYCLDRFEITVDKSCYIVTVRESLGPPVQKNKRSDLPKWVFESDHAIWLADENTSIRERASKGEFIRQQLTSHP